MVQQHSHHTQFYPIPPETLSYFQSTPQWPILADKFFNDPALAHMHIEPRSLGTDRQFTLITKTLATEGTFRAWQGFWKKDPAPGKPYGEFINVLAVGRDLNGHFDTLHGGITGVMLDEISGQVAYCHRDLDRIALTTKMDVVYKKAVKTPGIVVLRAWLEKVEGHLMPIKAVVESLDEEAYATADVVHREVVMKKFGQVMETKL